MKKLNFFFSLIFIVAISNASYGQFLEKLAKKAEKKVEREAEKRSEKRVNKGIDNVFDGVEEGIDDTVDGDPNKKDDAKKETKTKKTEEKNNSGSNQTKAETNTNKQNTPVEEVKQEPVLIWNKYDFVPGTEIIFEDNQEGEQNGEFPSKWDLKAGTVEIANLNGENVIWFRKSSSKIIPLIKVANYLPEEFTIEFDYQMKDRTQHHYALRFNGDDKRENSRIDFGGGALGYYATHGNTTINGDINAKFTPGWKHAAISFNKRALKVYVDDQRVLNIPNTVEALKSFSITSGLGTSATEAKSLIKNIRIAKGAVPLYDKFLTDGKFITTGIKFDIAKATIKPESMGTINYVVKMMQDHPELKFSVEGHTDSDGDDATNQKLSEARAKAVMETMIKAGISADRLTSKGHGESKPMSGNDTPEGKAQNRRVEFVKI
jgi:outer membrane protein OmpA-like peptidoglycan-associated protein